MKEYKTKYNSFIGGWFIPKEICKNIINYFEKNREKAVAGCFGKDSLLKIDKNIKDSIDLRIENTYFEPPFDQYRIYLQNCLNEYIKKYSDANECERFNADPYNIQYYPAKGGFKRWHSESTSKDTSKRHLVFMTYLNDVKDAGTEFKYQKIKTECKQGLTLIWPSSFTHTHRGIINKKYEKYIVTGWFSFI